MQFSLIGSKHLGKVIKRYRAKNKVTQSQLASTVECHTQFVSNWERGVSTPPLYMLNTIRLELDIPQQKIVRALKRELSDRVDKIFN